MQLLLLNLYDSVLVPILSEWINDEDLCCLDTAVCSKKMRHSFLRIMDQCSIINTDFHTIERIKSFKSWMLCRGLALKKYYISDNDPDAKQLFSKRRHLLHLESHSYVLISLFLEATKATADVVRLSEARESPALLQFFRNYGHVVTDLCCDGDTAAFAEVCSNLISVKTYNNRDVFPFVEHCPRLRELNNVNLTSLVGMKKCKRTYGCDLKRTSVVDESAVCLGEGKYFNMTGLRVSKLESMTDEDVQLLTPLVRHLTTLDACASNSLVHTAAENCYHLTSLDISNVSVYPTEVVKLLEHSPSLIHLRLTNENETASCPFLIAISLHCMELEKCLLGGFTVSSDALSIVFEKCRSLKKFQFSINVSIKFRVESHGKLTSDRHTLSLLLDFSVAKPIEETILKHYPRIRSVHIQNYSNKYDQRLNELLRSTSCVTNLSVQAAMKFATSCSIDSEILSKLKLTHLTLWSCLYGSRMLSVIANTCPDLNSLDLTDNDLTSDDLTPVLVQCSKLTRLILRSCTAVTASLFPLIKLPRLRYLDVVRTGIKQEEVVLLKKTNPPYNVFY